MCHCDICHAFGMQGVPVGAAPKIQCDICHIMRPPKYVMSGRCYKCLCDASDPFFKSVRVLISWRKVGGTQPVTTKRFKFHIPHDIQQRVAGRELQVRVKCFDVRGPLKVYPPIVWPLRTKMGFNGSTVGLRQRDEKGRGLCEAVDVSSVCRAGDNTLAMGWTDGAAYVVSVVLTERRAVEELVKQVAADRTLDYQVSLDAVKALFHVDDDDVVPMNVNIRTSLKCPIGLVRIQTPARGKDCRHLQCFDLETFVRTNSHMKTSSPGFFHCPSCVHRLSLEDIVVDGYMAKVLAETKAERVDVDEDGGWKAV